MLFGRLVYLYNIVYRGPQTEYYFYPFECGIEKQSLKTTRSFFVPTLAVGVIYAILLPLLHHHIDEPVNLTVYGRMGICFSNQFLLVRT